MDEQTREYRKAQFERLKEEYVEFKTKVKFIRPVGETQWMDIEEEELQVITEILTKGVRE